MTALQTTEICHVIDPTYGWAVMYWPVGRDNLCIIGHGHTTFLQAPENLSETEQLSFCNALLSDTIHGQINADPNQSACFKSGCYH